MNNFKPHLIVSITIGGGFGRFQGLFGFGHWLFCRRLLFIFLGAPAVANSNPIVAPFHLAHLNLRGGHFLLIWPPFTQSDKLV